MVANAISLLSFYMVKVPFENISLLAANQHSSLDGMFEQNYSEADQKITSATAWEFKNEMNVQLGLTRCLHNN